MSFSSDPAMWAHVRLMLRGILEMQRIPSRDANLLSLGMDEAFTNIMRHAYGGNREGAVELEVNCDKKRLNVTIRDYGCKVPTESIRSRDLNDIRPGGLGVHIMHSVFDVVRYDNSPQDGTILLLEKDLTKRIMPESS